ncbi:MDR family MFS transporter [Krasilnikovia cinnamomea]|uniref:MDR family MFS transporter n=1 Tax=Krasilnikovia cinnamomea TaxID=349313 RepID=UPI001F5EF122|nr:MFS transporter [Krasilnikovia cinnamomea]
MPGWLRQAAGGLPRPYWFLWTGTLINKLGAFAIVYLAIYLTAHLHFSQTQAGLVIGAYGAGGALGTLTGGVLADRWGRRPTLLTAQFGTAALMLALGFAQGFWQLAVCAFLLGASADAARPAFQAMMIDVVPPKDRLRAFALHYWAVNLGFAFAAILAGFAAQADYLLLFAIDAGTTAVTAVTTLVFLKESRPALAPATGVSPGRPAGLRAVLRDRVFLGFIGLNLLIVLVLMQHMSTLPITMTAGGLSPATYGWVAAVNGIMIVAGQLFVPRLLAGRQRSRVLAMAALLIGAGFGLCAFAGTAWMFAGTVVIWTLGEMIQSPSNSALVAELSPAALRGRYQGMSSLSWSVATALAPILGGFVQEHLGDSALWLSCAGLGVVVAAGQLASGPARERRVAALRAAAASAASAVVVARPRRAVPREKVKEVA